MDVKECEKLLTNAGWANIIAASELGAAKRLLHEACCVRGSKTDAPHMLDPKESVHSERKVDIDENYANSEHG